MGWRAWTTSCLVAAIAGVLAGAVYVAATGSFDAPEAGALPAPSERTGTVSPTGGPAPAAVSPAATAARGTSAGRNADDRTAKEPKAKAGRAKPDKEAKAAKVKEPEAAKVKEREAAPAGTTGKGSGRKAPGKKQKGK